MGICASSIDSNGINKKLTCWICEQPLADYPRYLKCSECDSIFHVKCLYRCSDSMNKCLKCGKDSLILVDKSPSAKSRVSRWSSSKNNSQKSFSSISIKL